MNNVGKDPSHCVPRCTQVHWPQQQALGWDHEIQQPCLLPGTRARPGRLQPAAVARRTVPRHQKQPVSISGLCGRGRLAEPRGRDRCSATETGTCRCPAREVRCSQLTNFCLKLLKRVHLRKCNFWLQGQQQHL